MLSKKLPSSVLYKQGRIQQVAEGACSSTLLEKLFICVSLIGRLKSLSDLVLAG